MPSASAAVPPAGSVDASATSSLYDGPLRAGAWTHEEVEYINVLMEDFRDGALVGVSDGTTLRGYLAKKTHCRVKRVSKKLEGTNYNGRLTFKAKHDLTPQERHFRSARLSFLQAKFEKSWQDLKLRELTSTAPGHLLRSSMSQLQAATSSAALQANPRPSAAFGHIGPPMDYLGGGFGLNTRLGNPMLGSGSGSGSGRGAGVGAPFHSPLELLRETQRHRALQATISEASSGLFPSQLDLLGELRRPAGLPQGSTRLYGSSSVFSSSSLAGNNAALLENMLRRSAMLSNTTSNINTNSSTGVADLLIGGGGGGIYADANNDQLSVDRMLNAIRLRQRLISSGQQTPVLGGSTSTAAAAAAAPVLALPQLLTPPPVHGNALNLQHPLLQRFASQQQKEARSIAGITDQTEIGVHHPPPASSSSSSSVAVLSSAQKRKLKTSGLDDEENDQEDGQQGQTNKRTNYHNN